MGNLDVLIDVLQLMMGLTFTHKVVKIYPIIQYSLFCMFLMWTVIIDLPNCLFISICRFHMYPLQLTVNPCFSNYTIVYCG